MPTWLAVSAGGAAGTLARYLIGIAVAGRWTFPWGTLGINVVGSFLLGVIAGIVQARGGVATPATVAVSVGFCGGFTTFSAFSLEVLQMVERGEWSRALAYVVASVALGVAAAAVGLALARGRAG